MRIAVYCGSASGNKPEYLEAAVQLGRYFAAQGIDLVYGGGKVGLMGAIADAVLIAGGNVYGFIPKALEEKEIAHKGLTKLTVVPDMHTRKAAMADMADAFVALPGGVGTFEEIFEAWTWAQLGYHNKPCAFYNVEGFYEPLFAMIDSVADSGFMKQDYIEMLIKTNQPEELLAQIQSYQAPKKKWT
ncbi:TIGR00730 family Rossman fold protein [Oceanospirillum maris]|jgi:uncharacterized protein (TIGR00730 family)|uniref:LOG family protein n=1 Tax=Oceanospirillum maris TaxID=64977 RepID=UPI0004103160|nr:TIGR00730 family Rossman fold protein [Oceanospirillum maris]